VQVVPSKVQVSLSPPVTLFPPKSTTSLPNVAIVAPSRAGGGFETETGVQLVPLNIQVSFIVAVTGSPKMIPPKSTTSLRSVAIAARERASGGFERESWVQVVPSNVQVSFRE